MTFISFLICLECHSDHSMQIWAQSEHFKKKLTFDPLYDLCLLTYDLHFIFNMFRVSQWSFHVNLSSIGAFFLIWPLTPYMTFAFWPMTFISFLICLECHSDHSMQIWAQSEHFKKNWPLTPYDLCLLTYDLHFIFNMFRVSQWSFHVNLSSIGAFF